MEKRTVIAELISIANILDDQNLANEADQITRIAQDLASAPSFDYIGGADPTQFEGPDDYRADEMFLGADKHNDEQVFMMELAKAEAMDRINEIKSLEEPTEADIAEYSSLLNFLEGNENSEDKVQTFANNLSDGGVEVQ
jgi:hypothetical protein